MAHCDDGLRKIYRAIRAFQKDNDGKNPLRLEDLLDASELTAWDLVCPTSDDAVGQCSYAYRGSDLDDAAPSHLILAHDKKPLHKGRRNILFVDGRLIRPHENNFQKAITADNTYRKQMGIPTASA